MYTLKHRLGLIRAVFFSFVKWISALQGFDL